MIERMIEESIIDASDPEFVPRTVQLNGRPFKVMLGPSLIRFYEGAVIGFTAFPWPDFNKMVRLILIGEKRSLYLDLGRRPEDFPFPVKITVNLRKCAGRIFFEDGQEQDIRAFGSEKNGLETRAEVDQAKARLLRQARERAAGEAAGVQVQAGEAVAERTVPVAVAVAAPRRVPVAAAVGVGGGEAAQPCARQAHINADKAAKLLGVSRRTILRYHHDEHLQSCGRFAKSKAFMFKTEDVEACGRKLHLIK